MKFLGLKPILSLSLFVLVLLFPTLAGAEDAIHQVDIRKIEENASLSPRQKADLLIQEAEGFNNLYGAMWADEILQRALIWQPDNLKAQMYRKLIAPALVFKGILTRLDPFVKGEPQDRVQSFYKFRDQDIKGTGLGQFLTDGPRDIRTEKQMQKVFDDFIVKQDQARLFFAKIKRVKNLSFIVRYNRIKHSHSANIKKCNAWKIRPGVFARKLCDNLISRYYKVDMVDFEVFQQVMAGVKIYSALAVAYDTTGLIDHNRFTYQNQLNPEQIITRMRQVEAFGRIRRVKPSSLFMVWEWTFLPEPNGRTGFKTDFARRVMKQKSIGRDLPSTTEFVFTTHVGCALRPYLTPSSWPFPVRPIR